MKRWIAIFFLSIYVITTTEAYQFLKIPVLVEHFIEHRQQNPDMTFLAFLKMHYDHPVKDADYKTDQQLPFVSHSTCLSLIFTLDNHFSFELPKRVFPSLKSIAPYKNIFYNKDILQAIWQPPRTC